jgi:hypothetical protein
MKQICQAHIERLRPKPKPDDPVRAKAEAACRIPIESNLDTRRLDRALDRIESELGDGDSREDEDQ